MVSVDIKKALLMDHSPFKPLDVTSTELLGDVVETGHLQPDQRLLLSERDGGVIALDMKYMSYHHVAQGNLAGEPWLVCF